MGTKTILSAFGVILCISLSAAQWEEWPTPPLWEQKPQMARYLSHYASWGVLSLYSPIYGYPFGSVVSISDGLLSNSTGIPYMYLSDNGDTRAHIMHNNSAGLTISMAESEKCRQSGMDPLEPLCSRVVLLGNVLQVKDKQELAISQKALFKRHPAMQYWPKGHGWNVYKLDIKAICLLDFYGGASHVSIEDYYSATPNNKT